MDPIPFTPILQAQTQTVEIEEALSGFDESESDPSSEEAYLLSGFDEEEPEMELTEIVAEEKGWLDDFSGKTGASLSFAYEQQAPGCSQHPDWRGIRKQRGFLQLKWDHRVFQNARIFIEGKVSGDLLPDTLDEGVYSALAEKNFSCRGFPRVFAHTSPPHQKIRYPFLSAKECGNRQDVVGSAFKTGWDSCQWGRLRACGSSVRNTRAINLIQITKRLLRPGHQRRANSGHR